MGDVGDVGGAVAGGIAVAKEGINVTKWGAEKIKSLAMQFREGVNLSFVGKVNLEGYVNAAKTPEYGLIKKYIESKKHRSIMLTGIRLRTMDSKQDYERRDRTKQKIYDYAGKEGRRLAQFVQSKLFLRSWSILIGDSLNEADIRKKVNEVVCGLDKYVEFVDAQTLIENKSNEMYTCIVSNKPSIYMIGATGNEAIDNAKRIADILKQKQISNYDYEEQHNARDRTYYVFIKRNDS